jgi:hypothetical protein
MANDKSAVGCTAAFAPPPNEAQTLFGFGDAHAMGSLNIGVASPSFAVWCGFFVNPDLPISLVVEYEAEAQRAQLELARIGFDQVVGFIAAEDLELAENALTWEI